MKGRSLIRALVIGIVACVTVPVPALGGGSPPPAIAQYVETAPSAGGATVTGYGKAHTRQLPKPVAQQLEQQAPPAAAAALKEVATSSHFGAPQSTLGLFRTHLYHKHRPEQRAGSNSGTKRPAAPAIVTSGAGSSGLVGLGVVLAVLTAAMGAVGLRNR